MTQIRKSLLFAASLVFLLSACGGGGTDSQVTSPSPAPAGLAATGAFNHVRERATLEAAVGDALRSSKADQVQFSYGEIPTPVTEVHRRSSDGEWAFGGAYFPIPGHIEGASPINALFVAQRIGDGWTVTLEDAEGFAQALNEASPEVTNDEERQLFASRSAALKNAPLATADAAAAQDIGLSLPYRRNDANWGMWGVHGDSGTSKPYNSIDFFAGDGRVLTSRGGVAYKFCTNSRWPFIKVVHDNGFTTGYYHLRNQPTINNGQRVKEGEYLGNIGVELPCGGSANGDHVHWSLWRGDANGRAEAVNGKLIGGWVWYEAAQAYAGYAERNGKKVYYNNKGLVNYGYGASTAAQAAGELPS